MKNATQLIEVLLVEDNPNDADLFIRVLRKNGIAETIHVCEDGDEALRFLYFRDKYASFRNRTNLKLIFLDIKLPKVSGLEVLSKIKIDDNLKTIPVVIVSSSREESDLRNAAKIGANSYIVKPVSYDDFASTMSQVCNYWLKLNELSNELNAQQ
jgi:two-component system response regulator